MGKGYKLNGRYDVYYDNAKQHIMARIGFKDDVAHGVLERFDMNGVKVYETVITEGMLDGLLKIYQGEKRVIQSAFTRSKVTNMFINMGYTYTVNYNPEELPHGEINISSAHQSVLLGTLNNGKFREVNYYNSVGDLQTSLHFNENGDLHGENIYSLDNTRKIKYVFVNGFRTESGSVVKGLYFDNRDMALSFVGHNLDLAGKPYVKI